jgi:hypothetical protein
MTPGQIKSVYGTIPMRPRIVSRIVADAAFSSMMEKADCAAYLQNGVLVESQKAAQSKGTKPYDEGGDPYDWGLYDVGYEDVDGGYSTYGYVVYKYPPDDPPNITLSWGGDSTTIPGYGGGNSGIYYPQNPPQNPACLPGIVGGLWAMVQSVVQVIQSDWKKLGTAGPALQRFVTSPQFVYMSRSAPMAFMEALSAIFGAPEIIAILALVGIGIGVWLILKTCEAGG